MDWITSWIVSWPSQLWTFIAAIATCVLALTVIIAISQIKVARRSTNAQIFVGLYKELRDETAIKKLRNIYEATKSAMKNSKDVQRDIDYVLDRLDTLGSLVSNKIIDKKLAIETYGGPPALRCWYCAKEYIRAEQDYRGYYAENFEAFVKLSLDYFNSNGIRVTLYREGKKHKAIDLVKELQKPELGDLRPRSAKDIRGERN